ncbi:MAG: bifunctional oligoribonuclease/PAP phosphatase NrnA [Candidatus Brocadiia bacterium]
MSAVDNGKLPDDRHKIDGLLRGAAEILVTTHVRMDGDAVGSVIALSEVLSAMGKRIAAFNPSPVPEVYRFLDPSFSFLTAIPQDRVFDLLVVLDAASLERLDGLDKIAASAQTINIDHHISNTLFGIANWVDPRSPCTGEMLLSFFEDFGYSVSQRAAEALYVALLTDTGRFSFGNTQERAFKAAARLAGLGASPGLLAQQVYFSNSPAKMNLLKLAYSRLEIHADGKIASVSLRQREMEELGLTVYETSEIVDIPRACGSAELAVMFLETDGERTRVSLRSKGGLDCNVLAAVFGGGGHRAAAGAVLEMPMDRAQSQVIAQAEAMLAKQGSR